MIVVSSSCLQPMQRCESNQRTTSKDIYHVDISNLLIAFS